jgi:hypothetical protein
MNNGAHCRALPLGVAAGDSMTDAFRFRGVTFDMMDRSTSEPVCPPLSDSASNTSTQSRII